MTRLLKNFSSLVVPDLFISKFIGGYLGLHPATNVADFNRPVRNTISIKPDLALRAA